LRSKGQFQARLKTAEDELDRLRIKTKTDTKAIRELSADNSILNTKLRDREHELREKKRLLDVRCYSAPVFLRETVLISGL
jgi:hypothetical protein